MLQSKLQTVT